MVQRSGKIKMHAVGKELALKHDVILPTEVMEFDLFETALTRAPDLLLTGNDNHRLLITGR